MPEIIYPLTVTYFIAWEGERIAYGRNEPDQCTTTGLANFELFTVISEYMNRLLELGITPEMME